MTGIVTVAYLIFVSLKIVEFNGGYDGKEFFSERKQNFEEPINLKELDFSFAVEFPDPRIGSLVAY